MTSARIRWYWSGKKIDMKVIVNDAEYVEKDILAVARSLPALPSTVLFLERSIAVE